MRPSAFLALVAVLLYAGCKLDLDLTMGADGSASGAVAVSGSQVPDDANGFRNHLMEKGFTVEEVSASRVDGERRIDATVGVPPFDPGARHALLLELHQLADGTVRAELNKENLKADSYELRLHLPGDVLRADGGRIEGRTVIYPGPERARAWTLIFRPATGDSAALAILVGVPAVALAILLVRWMRRRRATPAT